MDENNDNPDQGYYDENIINQLIWNTKKGRFVKLFSQSTVPLYDSRILVVGAFKAGKTTLVTNLINEIIPIERQSTDGIDIYFAKLLLDVQKGNFLKMKAGEHNFPDAVYQKVLAYVESVSGSSNIDTEDLQRGQQMLSENEVLEELHSVIESFQLRKNVQDLGLIPIPVLDFAGQVIYFATHQTFITSHGIYIIVFNGSKSLHDAVTDDSSSCIQTTILDNIQQWISSILTYCSKNGEEYPKIMFVATHRDHIPDDDVERIRSTLICSIKECFADENTKAHLVLHTIFFVNALNPSDPEVAKLRDELSKTIVENPKWGKPVPKQFLILEMLLATAVDKGADIMHREEIEKLNVKSGNEPLSDDELDLFLRLQNVYGKLTYLDAPHLRDYVLVNPTFLINVLKSIVTAVPIVPSLKDGRLNKKDLSLIWSSVNISQFKNKVTYLIDLLVHNDILVEMRRYDVQTGKIIDTDIYLVPCMVTTHNKTTYVKQCILPKTSTGFVFDFKSSHIPTAIPNRMTACVISIWNVKEFEGVELLHSGFVAVSVDRKHDLVLKVEKNAIAVYLVHKNNKNLIVRDLASSIRECLEQNLTRILEGYYTAYSDEKRASSPFEIKFKSNCLSNSCLLDYQKKEEVGSTWKCDTHGMETTASDVNIWYTDRNVTECKSSCEGLAEAVLSMLLNDSQLLKISNNLTEEQTVSLALHLGATHDKLEELKRKHEWSSMAKFYSLRICREKNKCCRDFVKAMRGTEIDIHTMCKILRQEGVPTDLTDNILKSWPTDELIDKLCLRIGSEWMVLGLELGLDVERLEQIEYDNPRVLREVSRQMLYTWRNRDTTATIKELLEGIGRAGRNPALIRQILEECVSYPDVNSED